MIDLDCFQLKREKKKYQHSSIWHIHISDEANFFLFFLSFSFSIALHLGRNLSFHCKINKMKAFGESCFSRLETNKIKFYKRKRFLIKKLNICHLIKTSNAIINPMNLY